MNNRTGAIRWATGVAAALALLAAAPVLAYPAGQTPAQAATLAAQAGLIGTWALVRYEDVDASGKMMKPFGEHPKGYFVYDATGHVNIQIARDPPVAGPNVAEATMDELRATLRSHVAYFGTYRLDMANGTVTHVVEGSLRPDYRGTDQVRPFKLVGDVLTISKTLPDGSRYLRELHRVK